MTGRMLSIAAFTVVALCAAPAAGEPLASFRPGTDGPLGRPDLSAYRDHVASQLGMLAGMTKLMAAEIRDGNLGAAQNDYAPAHRALGEVGPILYLMPDLRNRLDAAADDDRHATPEVSGFHRIERGLFARHATAGLTPDADRLVASVQELRAQAPVAVLTPSAMLGGAAQLVDDMAANALGGDEERYSHTDLWDVEAKIDGVREVLAVQQPGLRAGHADVLAGATRQIAAVSDVLARHQDGCGFKTYEDVARDDRLALKAALVALAADLSALQGAALAMD